MKGCPWNTLIRFVFLEDLWRMEDGLGMVNRSFSDPFGGYEKKLMIYSF